MAQEIRRASFTTKFPSYSLDDVQDEQTESGCEEEQSEFEEDDVQNEYEYHFPSEGEENDNCVSSVHSKKFSADVGIETEAESEYCNSAVDAYSFPDGSSCYETASGWNSLAIDWNIKASERKKYEEMFHAMNPVAGKLPGDKVKPVMINSKLPLQVLEKIWDLSDTDQDGFLSKEEFILAMYLVYKALENIPVPSVLPPELVSILKRKHSIPGMVQVLPDVLPQGIDNMMTGRIRRSSTPSSDIIGRGSTWIINAVDKAKFDEMFHALDTDRDGFVTGLDVKDIFLKSGLQQAVLAHIWNLCDIKQNGKLNSEQFALAMYLVQQKIQGLEVPATLYPDMIPPTLRPKPSADIPQPCICVQTHYVQELVNLVHFTVQNLQNNVHNESLVIFIENKLLLDILLENLEYSEKIKDLSYEFWKRVTVELPENEEDHLANSLDAVIAFNSDIAFQKSLLTVMKKSLKINSEAYLFMHMMNIEEEFSKILRENDNLKAFWKGDKTEQAFLAQVYENLDDLSLKVKNVNHHPIYIDKQDFENIKHIMKDNILSQFQLDYQLNTYANEILQLLLESIEFLNRVVYIETLVEIIIF